MELGEWFMPAVLETATCAQYRMGRGFKSPTPYKKNAKSFQIVITRFKEANPPFHS